MQELTFEEVVRQYGKMDDLEAILHHSEKMEQLVQQAIDKLNLSTK